MGNFTNFHKHDYFFPSLELDQNLKIGREDFPIFLFVGIIRILPPQHELATDRVNETGMKPKVPKAPITGFGNGDITEKTNFDIISER